MRSGKIRQVTVRRKQRKVKLALKANKSWLTANVGERIVLELHERKVQEAFRHLNGRYRNALETQAKPRRWNAKLTSKWSFMLRGQHMAQGSQEMGHHS